MIVTNDTVTPPETGEGDAVETTVEVSRVSPEDYKSRGQTRVNTPVGYAFAPNNKDLPEIDHSGVMVTKEQADALVDESDGLVRIVVEKEDED